MPATQLASEFARRTYFAAVQEELGRQFSIALAVLDPSEVRQLPEPSSIREGQLRSDLKTSARLAFSSESSNRETPPISDLGQINGLKGWIDRFNEEAKQIGEDAADILYRAHGAGEEWAETIVAEREAGHLTSMFDTLLRLEQLEIKPPQRAALETQGFDGR